VGTPLGSNWGRRLAEKVRSLDDTRFVTNALNGFVAIMDRVGELTGSTASEEPRDVNSVITAMGEVMGQLNTSDLVTSATEESASVLDVVGFNYAETRYEPDALNFPNRIIVGSETFPGQIDELWRLVTTHAHVVGDFTWTGWDYLGEAGIGRIDYTDDVGYSPTGVTAAYPYLLAGAGDIDITGHRRPMSHYRETVYGLRHEPYVAVHRPQHHGRPTAGTPWAWTDSVSTWSWNVPAGSPITVDVYSGAEEIELLLNGKSVGIAKVGSQKPFLARFETRYEPGQLVAVARTAGNEQARTKLGTATGQLYLHATSDRTTIRADDTDLAYIEITLQDSDGTLATADNRPVTVAVEGPGTLAGLGSARPDTEEPFDGTECTTYDGRALAIIRPLQQGELRIIVRAEGCDSITVSVLAEQR
jgi:beta-galactosidase